MKNLIATSLFLSSLSAQASYQTFRNTLHDWLKLPAPQGIVFQRLSGEDCEVQVKSTPHRLSVTIFYPTSERPDVHGVFERTREITESRSGSELKFSSYFIACEGDQYDTARECWEYDHHWLTLKRETSGMRLIIQGYDCRLLD